MTVNDTPSSSTTAISSTEATPAGKVSSATISTTIGVTTQPSASDPSPRVVVAWAVVLTIGSLLVASALFWALGVVESVTNPFVEVPWTNSEGIALKPGPASFWYDDTRKVLLHHGPIDASRKKELLELADAGDVSYHHAVDRLAYSASSVTAGAFLWILVAGGVAGVLGVQIRSLFDFIGHACYKRSLDINLWWPWYVLRPVLGFLLGILVLGLAQGNILETGQAQRINNYWWIGLSALAGFGASDAVGKLRLLSKTLFGSDK